MSPTTRSEARILSRSMCHTAVFFRPASYTLMALNWSPSAYASMASTMPQLPGVSAPMSRWCAVVTEKPTSRPS